MPYESFVYVIYSSVSVTVSALIAFMFWGRRSAIGAKATTLLMISAILWTLSDLFSILANSMPVKLFWSDFTFIGVVPIPIIILVFSLQYTQNEKYLTRKNIFLASIIPVITLVIIWTNKFHHLFYDRLETSKVGILTIITPIYGLWFNIHAFYSYTIILISTLLLFKKLIFLPKIYRNQTIIIILAVLNPFICSMLYSLYIIPSDPIDPTSFSFSISGVLFFWGMFRYKLFELVPAARGAVVEAMSEFVIVLDNQNRIIDMNTSAQSLFARNINELIGQPILSVLGDSTPQFIKYLEILDIREKISIAYGSDIKYYDLQIAPLYDKRNKLSGRFIQMHDITDHEEMLVSLEQSRKAAEDANKAKSQFLATMSHEIRTPLNGIIGMSELLSSADLTEEEKQFLLSIQISANSLLDIINDILDFSKIEAGRLEFVNSVFNIKDLIDNMDKIFKYRVAERGLSLLWNISPDIPENLIGDSIRLKQILINLIGNSLKFTEKGYIMISIEQINRENDQISITFTVSDTGIGIPSDKISSLFEIFQQLDGSTTRKFGGTGLGLAIVKKLIENMSGTINVESNLGEGSSFCFMLPFKIAMNMNPEQDPVSPADDFIYSGVSILLAEDNKVNQLFMKKLLEKKNCKVDIAETGNVVLEKLSQNTYDLILMDIQMPEMDGYEATSAIRKSEINTGEHIPIIALTANATADDKIKCYQLGMDDYISKPVKSDTLISCIQRNLQN